jgi:hypothetical protein
MEKPIVNVNDIYADLAARFDVASKLFASLSSPDEVEGLLETLATGNQARFDDLVGRIDAPILGKCLWVKEVVTHIISTSTREMKYYLREDLTPAEYWTFWRICMKYSYLIVADAPIGDGPFLEELKAHNLVRVRLVTSTLGTLVEMPVLDQHLCI